MTRFAWISLVCAALLGCSDDGATSMNDDLTGTSSTERPVSFTSWVYVSPSASDADISAAIAREIKTSLGALRDTKVAFDDRGEHLAVRRGAALDDEAGEVSHASFNGRSQGR